MNPSNTQLLFFQHLKTQLPSHLSMVDEIAGILGISTDSAYRRIRGEKPMDLSETHKLCSRFNVSMDQLLNLQTGTFIFNGRLKGQTQEDNFEPWLQEVQYQFETISKFEKKHVYFLMKDIAPWVHFLLPELAAFRCFFYMKSILQDDALKGVKFSLDDPRYDKYRAQIKKISTLYTRIPITEIWNVETLNSVLNQIRFYLDAGAFLHKKDAKILYEKVEELINHTEKQAELGLKFEIGATPAPDAAEYRMFVNELILGNNTFFAELGEGRVTFINHAVMYFIGTRDERFNNATYLGLQNLMKKSTLISTIGEKDRGSFFNRLRDKIHERITALG